MPKTRRFGKPKRMGTIGVCVSVGLDSGTMFFLSQFCDVAQLAIMHKNI
jgi:hypothetical protein